MGHLHRQQAHRGKESLEVAPDRLVNICSCVSEAGILISIEAAKSCKCSTSGTLSRPKDKHAFRTFRHTATQLQPFDLGRATNGPAVRYSQEGVVKTRNWTVFLAWPPPRQLGASDPQQQHMTSATRISWCNAQQQRASEQLLEFRRSIVSSTTRPEF